MEEPKRRLDTFLAGNVVESIQKEHGPNILARADNHKHQRSYRILTGIFPIDYALGGGIPVGKTTIIYGHKSTGKSVICLRALSGAQRTCTLCYTEQKIDLKTGEVVPCACGQFREHLCAYIDVEGSWDTDWVQLCGVRTDDVLLSRPEYAEQALDIVEALLRSNELDLIIVDSLAFLTPAKEIEEGVGKALQAEQARTFGRAIRKFGSALNYVENHTERRPTLLFTNQIRMKTGVVFGSPETVSGGLAPGFSSSAEIRTAGGKYVLDETTQRPVHVDLDFRVEKNKTSVAKLEGSWRLCLADTELKKKGDTYDEPAMLDWGIKIGLVEQEANKKGWSCLGEKYKTKTLFVERLIRDMVFRQTYCQTLLQILTAAG